MFENLSERLEKSFKLLKGQGRISEINIAETLKGSSQGTYLMLMLTLKLPNNLLTLLSRKP